MSYSEATDWSRRATLWQHFRQPVGVTPVEHVDAVAETVDSSGTQQLNLEISLNGEHISRAAFKAFGGVALLGCGSWLCQWLNGKAVDQLQQLKPGDLVEQITAQLELRPAEKPMAFLAEDIVPQLLAAIEVSKT